MYQSRYEEYLETEILTAEPIKLVQLMYRGVLDAIAGARAAVRGGDIATRSRLISKASVILNELALSLDHSKDSALCSNLVELYDYMLRRLIEANVKQSEMPLAEVESLLGGILVAWQQAGTREEETVTRGAGPYAGETATEYRQVSYAY